jgi:hypothetical protein
MDDRELDQRLTNIEEMLEHIVLKLNNTKNQKQEIDEPEIEQTRK